MASKYTVTLNEAQDKYFAEVKYSLEMPDKETSNSDVINHCLFELKLFEKFTGDQMTNWLAENYPDEYEKALKEEKFKTPLKTTP